MERKGFRVVPPSWNLLEIPPLGARRSVHSMCLRGLLEEAAWGGCGGLGSQGTPLRAEFEPRPE